MEAQLAVAVDSPEGLVIRIQAARLEGRTREAEALATSLMRALTPVFKTVAGRFPPHVRGSVLAEDLQQVAAIEAHKFVDLYDHTLATTRSPFRDHVYRRALSACVDYVKMHSADVHVSDWQSRGRRKSKGADGKVKQHSGGGQKVDDRPILRSRDDEGRVSLHKSGSRAGETYEWVPNDGEIEHTTPEDLMFYADKVTQVRAAVRQLVPFRAKLILQVFGIGCTQKSVAELARELKMPRRRLDEALQASLIDLKRALKRLEDEV